MIAIAITDPWAAVLNDVTDLESKLPGTSLIFNVTQYFDISLYVLDASLEFIEIFGMFADDLTSTKH